MASSVKKDARGIKWKLEMLLGDRIETYNQVLIYWFRKKCAMNEFKLAMSRILSPEMVYYHNQYLLTILDQALAHITPDKEKGFDRNCNKSKQQVLCGTSCVRELNSSPKCKPGRSQKNILKINDTFHKSNSNEECQIKTLDGTPKNVECSEVSVGRSYDCELCDKSYRYKWNLSRHDIKIHKSGEKQASEVYCDICQEIFLGRDIKEKHFQSVHMPLIKNYWASKKALSFSHECETCKKRFLHKRSLILHMETHNEAALPSSVCL